MRWDLYRYWVRKSKVLYSFGYVGMVICGGEWTHYFTSIEDIMKKSVIKGTLVTLMLAAACQPAAASTILIETGYSTARAQSSAEAYRNVVNSAIGGSVAGYGSKVIDTYDQITNESLFRGASSNIAFKSTINFGVSADKAGLWGLRAGVDFGNGGAVFLDGVALGYKSNDMWWDGSYSNSSQFFQFATNLAAGNHVLNIYGLEACCDGSQQVQFRSASASSFQTFAKTDGLIPAVPEPETYAMLLMGAGLMGCLRRRKLAVKA